MDAESVEENPCCPKCGAGEWEPRNITDSIGMHPILGMRIFTKAYGPKEDQVPQLAWSVSCFECGHDYTTVWRYFATVDGDVDTVDGDA